MGATGGFALDCPDWWSDKTVLALEELALMRLDLDRKLIEEPNSLVRSLLVIDFAKKEADFIKITGMSGQEFKQRLKDKIKLLQQENKTLLHAEKMIKDQVLVIQEGFVQGFRLETVEHKSIGLVYRITNLKTGKMTSKSWAKEVLAETVDTGVRTPGKMVDFSLVDPNNHALIHPEAKARALCLEVQGDLPTIEDWKELWEVVGEDLDKLEEILPGIKGPRWWSSSVHSNVESGGCCQFNGFESEYDKNHISFSHRGNSTGSVRCVIS